MSDIVERLREPWDVTSFMDWVQNNWAIRQEAAAEIERLTAALRECVEELEGYHEAVPDIARAALEDRA